MTLSPLGFPPRLRALPKITDGTRFFGALYHAILQSNAKSIKALYWNVNMDMATCEVGLGLCLEMPIAIMPIPLIWLGS